MTTVISQTITTSDQCCCGFYTLLFLLPRKPNLSVGTTHNPSVLYESRDYSLTTDYRCPGKPLSHACYLRLTRSLKERAKCGLNYLVVWTCDIYETRMWWTRINSYHNLTWVLKVETSHKRLPWRENINSCYNPLRCTVKKGTYDLFRYMTELQSNARLRGRRLWRSRRTFSPSRTLLNQSL